MAIEMSPPVVELMAVDVWMVFGSACSSNHSCLMLLAKFWLTPSQSRNGVALGGRIEIRLMTDY